MCIAPWAASLARCPRIPIRGPFHAEYWRLEMSLRVAEGLRSGHRGVSPLCYPACGGCDGGGDIGMGPLSTFSRATPRTGPPPVMRKHCGGQGAVDTAGQSRWRPQLRPIGEDGFYQGAEDADAQGEVGYARTTHLVDVGHACKNLSLFFRHLAQHIPSGESYGGTAANTDVTWTG